MNDIELNGETDDEDMEDGETGFDDGSAAVRTICDPGQPTERERREHMNTHRPYRSWWKFCVMGRGVRSAHREIGCSRWFGRGAPFVDGLWIPRREEIGDMRNETQNDVGDAG